MRIIHYSGAFITTAQLIYYYDTYIFKFINFVYRLITIKYTFSLLLVCSYMPSYIYI